MWTFARILHYSSEILKQNRTQVSCFFLLHDFLSEEEVRTQNQSINIPHISNLTRIKSDKCFDDQENHKKEEN